MKPLAFTKDLPRSLVKLAERFPKLIRSDDITVTPEAERDLSNIQYGKLKPYYRKPRQ